METHPPGLFSPHQETHQTSLEKRKSNTTKWLTLEKPKKKTKKKQ
jgi:hypothetical protein